MIIEPGRTNPRKRAPWKRRRSVLVALLAVLVSVVAFRTSIKEFVRDLILDLGYGAGVAKAEYSWTGHIVSDMPYAARNWIGSLDEEAPSLMLDIKFRHLSRLRQQRAQALAEGVLAQGEDDMVPATIRFQDRAVRVELRLKGDIPAGQFTEDSWSFRVHVKGDDHLFGMRRFNLHPPLARNFHAEPVFLDHVRHLGILAPRYMFVRAGLNGDDLGIMAIEEHFSKELLESQGRRDGVILKLDESRFFVFQERDDRFSSPFNSFLASELMPFRLGRILKSPTLLDDLRVATGLYRAFVEGRLKPSQVFDAKCIGRFMAVAQVWSAWHAASWRNIRFYYNPITARLEPIAYDAELLYTDEQTPEPLHGRLLADREIRKHYTAALAAMAEEVPQSLPVDLLSERQREYLGILHRSWPFLKPLDIAGLAEKARESIEDDPIGRVRFDPRVDASQPRRELPPSGFRARDLALVNIVTDGSERHLEMRNLVNFPVSVSAEDKDQGATGALRVLAVLPPTPLGALPAVVRIGLGESDTLERAYLSADGVNGGAWVRSRRYFPASRQVPIPPGSLDAVAAHDFLDFDAGTRMVNCRPGVWDVSGTISLPEGVRLVLRPGTELRFESDAALILRGPSSFLGTATKPVVLRGRGDRRSLPWRGVAVFNEGNKANWSHVRVFGTSGVDFQDWHLTGGVSLYRGKVAFENCQFRGNTAEDALNLIHTEFQLVNVDVSGASSDGIDVDFGCGTVRGGTLSDIGKAGGGDGLDFSGARATISKTRFSGIGDKAISVGERSTIHVTGVEVSDAQVGAAAKDRSYLRIGSAKLSRVHLAALMAYTKKPEFGGALLEAENIASKGVGEVAVVQKGSMLRVDGVPIEPVDLDVDTLYATTMRRARRQEQVR